VLPAEVNRSFCAIFPVGMCRDEPEKDLLSASSDHSPRVQRLSMEWSQAVRGRVEKVTADLSSS
jgi:hypothetical protein